MGISNPFDRTGILTVVAGRDFAVATSGVVERGAHVVNPVTGVLSGELASVTVVGASLTRVDAYATAAFAMGRHGFEWLEARSNCDALVVAADGAVAFTTNFPGADDPPPDLE